MDFKILKSSLRNFDWRTLKKYAGSNTADDLNHFLEKLPQNAGNTLLGIAAVVWFVAGAVGLYTTIQLQQLTEIRAELEEAQALQPTVPQIQDIAVNGTKVGQFIKKIEFVYDGLDIKASGASVLISASSTASFGQFREAVAHIQNGGSGWRVTVDRLCVGRECDKYPLAASLKINRVSVSKSG